jgi:hypothetical protein
MPAATDRRHFLQAAAMSVAAARFDGLGLAATMTTGAPPAAAGGVVRRNRPATT